MLHKYGGPITIRSNSLDKVVLLETIDPLVKLRAQARLEKAERHVGKATQDHGAEQLAKAVRIGEVEPADKPGNPPNERLRPGLRKAIVAR
jgi:hypothetical protein